jgi:hypothetical protein
LWFRSRDRRVLKAWADGQAAVAAYADRIREVLTVAQAGQRAAVFDASGEFAGVTAAPGSALPPGWRRDGGLAVPDPSVAAGRWVTAAIAQARYPGDPRRGLPGLPPGVVSPQILPGWRADLLEAGAALYIGWPADSQDRLGGWPDPLLWEPVNRAETKPAAGGEQR